MKKEPSGFENRLSERGWMFTQTVEYALRAVVHLAASAPETRHNSESIAESTKVPKAYLSKVLKQLVSHGIIDSNRGAGGGFRLAKNPEKLTVLDVVNSVEPIQRITTCPLGLRSHAKQLCPLHCRMDKAMESIEIELGRTTIAEVLADPSTSKPLCDFPAGKKSKR
jgi:Rrf2 family protein